MKNMRGGNMANPLRIQAASKLVESRMKQTFLDVKRRFHQGLIKSQTEYLYTLYQSFHQFYESINKPTMVVRKADRIPSGTEYNLMVNEIHQDLTTLYEESERILQSLYESFRQMEIDRRKLENRLKRVEDQLKEIDTKINQEVNEVVFRESFIDQNQYDQDMVRDNLAYVWTREGVLTLQPRIAESFVERATARIVRGNGLPGNTKQVRMIAGEMKFVGEEGLHINLADILDDNADTWFEYETFYIHPRVLAQTNYLGYDYAENVSWINPSGEPLTLTLEIELPEAKPINWFSINPFIPNDKGASAAFITSIEIHDGKGGVYRPLYERDVFQEEKIYLFGRRECKRIVITFEQPNAYETEVGHLFYKELEKQQVNYLDRIKYQIGKRIPGIMPSIENLGVQYDPEQKQIVYPTVKRGDTIDKLTFIKQNLFSVPPQPTPVPDYQVGFENLPAERYVIGIRDIGIASYEFEATSEYVSKNFISSSPIIGVTLTTDEEIPVEFPEGEWIRYYISPDNGATWYRIYPRGVAKPNAKLMYLFNTNTPQEGRIDQFGYVDLPEPVHQLRLRIELERPNNIPNAVYYTPIVRGYQLHVITKGEESP